MISNHINPGIREITVQTDNRKTLRVRLRGSQPWFSIPSSVVRHQIPLLSQAVVRHQIPPSRKPMPATNYPPLASRCPPPNTPLRERGLGGFLPSNPASFQPAIRSSIDPFRERGRAKRDAGNKLAPAAVLQVPAQARPWSMISARRCGPIPFTRTRSSKDAKGRSSRICRARLSPMCLISIKDSTVAELTST